MTPRGKHSSQRLRGFTLVEMMVALIAGSVVISGAYFLSGKSANNFNAQMSLADTQTSLRMAMEQVRRDFARAGYLGSRNSVLRTNNCNVDTSDIGAVTAAVVTVDGSLTANANLQPLLNNGTVAATTNLTRADLVRLQGAYAAPSMFPVANTGAIPLPTVIELDSSITTFQMVFSDAPADGSPAVPNRARFAAVFAPGRAVRFESDGNYYFRRITASSWAAEPPTITLATALPDIGCAPRAGAFVSPLSLIQYAMEPVTAAAATTDATLSALMPRNATLMSAQRPVLVRREFRYAGNPLLMNTSVVLDNAVEFQVRSIINTVAAPGIPTFAPQDGTPAAPEQLRSLIVTLSARSAEGERTRAHLPRAALNLPMLTFIGNDLAGQFYVSRVRTMRGEIFLPNTVNR